MSEWTITLPEAEEVRAALAGKFEEYRDRTSTSTKPGLVADAVNKQTIVELLLANGRVTHDEAEEARRVHPKFDKECSSIHVFNQGFEVIEDYCLTGGKNTSQGTGFPRRRTPEGQPEELPAN